MVFPAERHRVEVSFWMRGIASMVKVLASKPSEVV